MDSGLGSDDDHRSRTKEQKQLHNQLLSECLVEDNTKFSASNVAESSDLKRIEERRQGALLFQRSIPQFSMLQISEPSEDNNYEYSETDTPYNSIEQTESGPESIRKSPLGFYVDLSDITEVNANPSSSTTKNIFSMVIDFEAPKKDKPVKLTSSLATHKRNKLLNKSKLVNEIKLSSSTSSINSVASTSRYDDDNQPNPHSTSKPVSTKLKSLSSQSSSSSECVVIERSKEGVDREFNRKPTCESPREDVKTESHVNSVNVKHNLRSSNSFSEKSMEINLVSNKTAKSQTCPQFVKLSDLEPQESRIEVNFTPCMSRSIPESSWVESPLLMCHSLGFRSAPHPIEAEDSPQASSESDLESTRPKRYQNKLGTDLLRMFLEEIEPDVTVEVEGHRLKAHKCILASRCQYFAALLSGNWLEKNGNIISLKGFSYESVYFSLCHIYSGTMHVPDSISLVELASLADVLCLEGLKEVVERALKQRHCHNFHKPCAGCCTGVLEVLPLSAAYGLEDLYQRCLQWITKHFVRVWPSRAFASLPRELREKCYRQHVLHMNPDGVLEIILACDKILATLPSARWVEPVSRLVVQLADACHLYHRQHFAAVLGCHYLSNLDVDFGFGVGQVEDQMLSAAKNLGVEQACRSYSRCCKMLEQNWSRPFTDLLYKLKEQLEQCLVRQADKLIRSNAWLRLDTILRNRIKELTPNLEPASRLPRSVKPARSPSTQKLNLPQNSSLSSSDSSRNSSPGVNQKGRLNTSTNANTSLRRSLLLAAKAPQVPPSPSTQRRSTLTQPTAASTARSNARNVKIPPKPQPSKNTTVRSPIQNTQLKPVPFKRSSNSVSRNASFGRKDEPAAPPKKPDSRAASPLKNDRRLSSPRKVDSRLTSPIKSNSGGLPFKGESPKKVQSPKQASRLPRQTSHSPKQANHTPSKVKQPQTPVMQRSSTFLKDEPTVLGKIL